MSTIVQNLNVSPTVRRKTLKLYWSAAIAFAALIGRAPAVQAANFNFTYAPGTTLEQMMGFEVAGLFWADYLADNATVNIFVETTNMLPDNVIGGALPGIKANVQYSDYRSHYSADIDSDADQTAFNHMEGNQEFQVVVDDHVIKDNVTLNMTRANAKALGIVNPTDTALDGYILMSDLANESVTWHYDTSDSPVPSGTLDYLSVALHEVGHTLGFVSGVDNPTWINTLAGLDGSNQSYKALGGNLESFTAWDMFRYNNAGDFVELSNLSNAGNPYFSINAGATNLANFASGQDTNQGGDGYQASHWQQQANHLGIMDPVLNAGQRRQISDLDKLAMDILGWDLQTGGTTLSTLNTQAKNLLAQKMGQSVAWMEANPTQAAALLAPGWLDADNDTYDDRGELLNDMVVSSEVYEWGWSGYWWGYGGYWWGWSGYWQEQGDDDLSNDGFWQNMSLQTLEGSKPIAQIKPDQTSAESVPEPTSILGLLGLGGLGLGSLYRRKAKGKPGDEPLNAGLS